MTELMLIVSLLAAVVCTPFVVGLIPLFVSMPTWLARIIWVLAGIIAVVVSVGFFYVLVHFLMYIPMAVVYWHAAATAGREPE